MKGHKGAHPVLIAAGLALLTLPVIWFTFAMFLPLGESCSPPISGQSTCNVLPGLLLTWVGVPAGFFLASLLLLRAPSAPTSGRRLGRGP